MPGAKYFLSLGGSALLGLAVLVVSIIAFILLFPFLVPLFLVLFPALVGIAALIAIFVFIVIVIYILAFLGVLVKYLFKPMEVSKEAKGYNMATVKEAGMRQKGRSKGKKDK
jgi:hypothetical protein